MSDQDEVHYQQIDGVPESTRRLLRVEILEDLSDSQLIWTIEHEEVSVSQYLPLAATLNSAVASIVNRLTLDYHRRQAEMFKFVNQMCEDAGVPSPFGPKTDIEEGDVDSAIDQIHRFLDEQNPDK